MARHEQAMLQEKLEALARTGGRKLSPSERAEMHKEMHGDAPMPDNRKMRGRMIDDTIDRMD